MESPLNFAPGSEVVAFKDSEGKYLAATWIGSKKCLQFSEDDTQGTEPRFEVIPPHDVTKPKLQHKIKSIHFNKYWEVDASSNQVLADANSSNRALFTIVDAGGNLVSIKYEGNQKFCEKDTKGELADCLHAQAATTNALETKFTIETIATSHKA